jgi:Na+/H+ antiporter NhaD/arsenite permease-like protein
LAWLANTASLLLPVSNLTNLLAAGHVGLGPVAFAGQMWLPQLAAISVTAVALWLVYWRRTARRFTPLAAPWASLATLLWWERCRAGDLRVPPVRFLLGGAVVAVAGTTLATTALLL